MTVLIPQLNDLSWHYFTYSLNLVCAHQELAFMVLLFVLVDCRVYIIEIDTKKYNHILLRLISAY